MLSLHAPALCRLALAPALQLLKSSDTQPMGHRQPNKTVNVNHSLLLPFFSPVPSCFKKVSAGKQYFQVNSHSGQRSCCCAREVWSSHGGERLGDLLTNMPSWKQCSSSHQGQLNATVIPQHPRISVLFLHTKFRKLAASFHCITGITKRKPFSRLAMKSKGEGKSRRSPQQKCL